MIVSHPFTDSGFVASPNANGEIGLLNITESDADQRRWREYMGKLIDGAKSAYEIYMMITKPYGLTFLKWMRRLREMTSSESIYDINDLVGAISNADMQLDKLTAVAEYAGVEDAKSITALANSLGLFTLIEDAEDHEDVGKHFVEHDPDYGVPETVVDFIDYDMLGEHST